MTYHAFSYRSFTLLALLAIFFLGACADVQERDEEADSTEVITEKETDSSASSSQFLTISDIHFDPYYDPTLLDSLIASDPSEWERIFQSSSVTHLSTYHSDANYPLLRSSLDKMKEAVASPDFIIIAGDFLAHDFQQKFETMAKITPPPDPSHRYVPVHDFTTKTMAFLKLMIEQSYPGIPVFSALGNNDAFCGDYMVQPASPFLRAVSDLWRPMLHDKDSTTFDSTFRAGGYYKVTIPTDSNLSLLVLNTILLSRNYNLCKYGCYCEGMTSRENLQPGTDQLDWFEGELKEAKRNGRKVWILQHIPPGFDTYGTLRGYQSGCIDNPAIDMHSAFNQRYLQLVQDHADVIAMNFAGHYHRDDFRLIPDSSGTSMVSHMIFFPSISPVNSNNPGFNVFDYDPRSGQVLDYTVYYADVNGGPSAKSNVWRSEYRFSDSYHVDTITTASLTGLHKKMMSDTDMQREYLRYYPVSRDSVSSKFFRAYWCIMGNVTREGLKQCSCGT